jgi:hypothetical protein
MAPFTGDMPMTPKYYWDNGFKGRHRCCRCDFSNSVSNRASWTWGDARCLTRCPPVFVSRSCPIFVASLQHRPACGGVLVINCAHRKSPGVLTENPHLMAGSVY